MLKIAISGIETMEELEMVTRLVEGENYKPPLTFTRDDKLYYELDKKGFYNWGDAENPYPIVTKDKFLSNFKIRLSEVYKCQF